MSADIPELLCVEHNNEVALRKFKRSATDLDCDVAFRDFAHVEPNRGDHVLLELEVDGGIDGVLIESASNSESADGGDCRRATVNRMTVAMIPQN